MKPGKIAGALAKILALILLLPLTIPFIIPELGLAYSGVTYELHTQDKIVALTFDDGPHPVYTPQILDILDRYQAKATFFMIGNRMEKYPEIVKEVSARGHLIANHTYTHPSNLRAESQENIKQEVARCQQTMERLSGQDTYLFRPPRGILNREIIEMLHKHGYTVVLWSISADHHDAPTPEMMAARVIKHIHPGEIILVHDGRTDLRWKDVEATRLIVKNLSEQGYRFVTLEALAPHMLVKQKDTTPKQ